MASIEGPTDSKPESQPNQLLTVLIGGIGAVIGYTVFRYMDSATSIMVLAGSIVGGVLGLLVFLFARSRDQQKLGGTALVSCLAAGAAGGFLLSAPVAVIFFFVIRGKEPPRERLL